ncbi:hypothetical protein [Nostoc sp.]|uniref:hypothetical protein n=1 Tax=Nostoc sp. TaxID=1180 RepID=UPI002FF48CD3
MSNDKPLCVYALFLRFSARRSLLRMCEVQCIVFEVFCKTIALSVPQQAMSNDKLLRVYALFLRFSARRSLLGMCEVRSLTLPRQAIALFLRFSARRSLCF